MKVKIQKLIVFCLLSILLPATMEARGKVAPERIAGEIEKLSLKNDAIISKLIEHLQKLPLEHGKFVTKDFVGTPYDRWFATPDGTRRSLYSFLWLDTFPRKTLIGNTFYHPDSETDFRRQIGNIPLRPQPYMSYSERVVLFDMRSADAMLYEAYEMLKKCKNSSNKKRCTIKELPIYMTISKYVSIPNEVYRYFHHLSFLRPNDPLWYETRLNRQEKKEAIKQVYRYWELVKKVGQRSRSLWADKISSMSPAVINNGFKTIKKHSTPQQTRQKYARRGNNGGFSTFGGNSASIRGGFANDTAEQHGCLKKLERYRAGGYFSNIPSLRKSWEQWRQKCIDSPDVKLLNWFEPDIVKTIEHHNNFGVLAVSAIQHRFEIDAQGSERKKYAYSFQEILERMVEKGRAVKLDAKGTDFWKIAREVLQETSPKGWSVYADLEEVGKYRGAILFNVKEGIGVWQPALYHAVKSLVPLAKEINANNAAIFKKVVLFNKLAYERAVKSRKKSTLDKKIEHAF